MEALQTSLKNFRKPGWCGGCKIGDKPKEARREQGMHGNEIQARETMGRQWESAGLCRRWGSAEWLGRFHCWGPEQEVGKGGKDWKLEVLIPFEIIRHESLNRRIQQARNWCDLRHRGMAGSGEVCLSLQRRSRRRKELDWTDNYSAFAELWRIF